MLTNPRDAASHRIQHVDARKLEWQHGVVQRQTCDNPVLQGTRALAQSQNAMKNLETW